MSATRSKKRLDTLFVIHATTALVSGLVAVLVPHLFEAFMVPHDDTGGFRPGDEGKIIHLVIRLYGAMILGQAWLVWNGRKVSDAHVRRSFVQAYAVVFALTSLSLARAQLTEGGHFNAWNWINILFFAGLSAMYSWFVFVEPIATFELPNRVLA